MLLVPQWSASKISLICVKKHIMIHKENLISLLFYQSPAINRKFTIFLEFVITPTDTVWEFALHYTLIIQLYLQLNLKICLQYLFVCTNDGK